MAKVKPNTAPQTASFEPAANKPKVTEEVARTFFKAVDQKALTAMKQIAEIYPDVVNYPLSSKKYTPLHFAVSKKPVLKDGESHDAENYNTIRALTALGADRSARDANGLTPFLLALSLGNDNWVPVISTRRRLENGEIDLYFDPKLKPYAKHVTENGEGAMHIAAKALKPTTIVFLTSLKLVDNPNVADNNGCTAMHAARNIMNDTNKKEVYDMMRALAQCGIDPMLKDGNGKTAIDGLPTVMQDKIKEIYKESLEEQYLQSSKENMSHLQQVKNSKGAPVTNRFVPM